MTDKENCMIRVSGDAFRCTASVDHLGREPSHSQCGCNVFQKDEHGRFVCNSCDARYVGETKSAIQIEDMQEKDFPF